MMQIVYILSLILISHSYSATKILMPTDNLPRELIYLTESLQELHLKHPGKIENIDETFKDLEENFKRLGKQELFFISKSEVYKTSLAFKPPLTVKTKFYRPEIILELNEKLKVVKLNSFAHWLVSSILKDTKNIFENKHFPSLLNERAKGALISGGPKKLQKKLNFTLPWLQSFLYEDPELFQYSLLPLMKKIISNISKKTTYLLNYSSDSLRKSESLVYFKEQSLEIDKAGKPVTVEDILDPLLNKLRNKNLPIPVDDWLGSEDDFATKLTPLKFEHATKDYIPPEKLPQPVDEDW